MAHLKRVKSLKLRVKSQKTDNSSLKTHNFLSGGLAQLVERLLCKQDVSGSSPLTST
jgi:hypothetical protein